MALGVAISLRAWPFFVHRRVGRGGKEFRFIKLRTLPTDVPRYADKYSLRRVRMSRFTQALRRHHLDELPQLFLVPLGRMSLVGPRPEMPGLHAAGDPAFAAARTSVRPGCTGLWQVGADAGKLIWEAPEYDLYYLANSSFRLDVWILWRSLVLIAGGGPVVLPSSRRHTRRHRRTTITAHSRVLHPPDGAAHADLPLTPSYEAPR